MSKKIKSIKIADKYTNLNDVPAPFYDEFVELVESNPEFFEIEYEDETNT